MNFLEEIIKEKQTLIRERKKICSTEELADKTTYLLKKSRFKTILERPGTFLIAEIKRASPSRGDLRPDLNVVDIANLYQQGGIELVSILTEEKFFKGSLNDLSQVSENTNLSILCKDFIIDSYQIREAKVHGADAVLLIAKILSTEELRELLRVVKSLKMDAVVEVHNETDLRKIATLSREIDIIGINHRDLEDFSIDLNVTAKLLPRIPRNKIVIAESGIGSTLEVSQFKKIGVDGILVGESLMKHGDIAIKIKEFMGALR
ncbi:indole-3-glycerol phosphate synthase TrpC [Candidatus Omnitrophota bacterium]